MHGVLNPCLQKKTIYIFYPFSYVKSIVCILYAYESMFLLVCFFFLVHMFKSNKEREKSSKNAHDNYYSRNYDTPTEENNVNASIINPL